MTPPRWTMWLLRGLAPRGRADDLLGDLEEAHRRRVAKGPSWVAGVRTGLEALELAAALMVERLRTGARRGGVPSFSLLDFKLGFRMLGRYPGLTVVGGLAIAFAICLGAGTFEFVNQVIRPRIPLDDGDRIVALQLIDRETAEVERQALYDFHVWRDELESVEDIGAVRMLQRNLITGEGRGEPIAVAEISASAFRIAGVPALHGRTLDAADEHPGAPSVVVLGYDVWQSRFAGDPGVLERTVRLGNEEATVVGVMPEGFEFPIRERMWMPLRLDGSVWTPREGPGIIVFGRLARAVTLEQAQVELEAQGLRTAAAHPDTHEHLAPRVLPFAKSIIDLSALESLAFLSVNVIVVLLLILSCGNVALLMFARTASRESEMVVRSALGASRGRIVTQLLAEALVLGSVGAIIGIGAARLALSWWLRAFEGMDDPLPFWITDRLAPTTILYAVALTLLGALITGVIPGLKVTRGIASGLKQTSPGGGGYQFGGGWTAVIIMQIAVMVALPVFGFFVRRDVVQIQSVDVGFPEQEYLSAQLAMDRDLWREYGDTSLAAFRERFGAAVRRLEDRLAADAAVTGVTFANRLPRMYHEARRIEVDDGGAAPLVEAGPGYRVASASIDPEFMRVFDAPIRAGRAFHPGDFVERARVVIVNESFVKRVLGGRNPIGRRLRYIQLEESGPVEEPGSWYDIVGVVRDMGMAVEPDPKVAGIYHPMAPGMYPIAMAVHIRGDAAAYGARLRTLAAQTEPTLRLDDVLPLNVLGRRNLEFYAFWFWLIVLVTSVASLLSLAGIYSIMSFTVSRRTREIGVRVALGSGRSSIALAIFRRPLIQVALGVFAGACLSALLSWLILRGGIWPSGVALVLAYAILMLGVCSLACIVPTHRALRISPTEALRADT
jgi:predicted permease